MMNVNNEFHKLILCQGIPGSGKSFWAHKWAQEDSIHRLRWSNDDVRNMMGEYWVEEREHVVAEIRNHFINYALLYNYDIVVDDMNLNPDTIKYYNDLIFYHNMVQSNSCHIYTLEYKKFDTPLDICIERDSKRDRPIGKNTIIEIYNKYKSYIYGEANTN